MKMRTLLSFLLTMLCILCSGTACAYDEDDLEWACGNSKELRLGEGLTCGNYTVVTYNFPRSDQKQFVGIKLYENSILVADQTLEDGEDYIHDDEVRITALELWMTDQDWTDVPTDLWAKIRIEPRGLPRFEVEFETDKEECEPYASIEMDLLIQNVGDAKADEVNVYVDAETLETFEIVQGNARYRCSEIERGDLFDSNTDTAAFDPITLRFGVPSVIEDTVFNITVNIECVDIRGVKYFYCGSYPLKVFGMFKISKSINDNVYMDEVATVTISLRNEGTRPINSIKVSDTMPPEFELNENSSLEWELDLKTGEYRSFTYSLKPLQPSDVGYFLPPAIAQWEGNGRTYSAQSDLPHIAVYGPKIELSKTVKPNTIEMEGVATVTIEVVNTGNEVASVNVTDHLPPGAMLTDGMLGANMILAAGESQSFSYNMRMPTAGSVELPPAVAHFVDTHYYEGTIVSETGSITVNPAATPRPAQTIDTPDKSVANTTTNTTTANTTTKTGETAGLGSVCVLAGFFAAVFVITRVRRR
ncbi:MAG: hypothetical protein U9N12_02225 [Euryarchaeota archaeon]|nr:hypothetical protein [Euryarchaeota archaeon]